MFFQTKNIDNNYIAELKYSIAGLKHEKARKRAYINSMAIHAFIDYLRDNGVSADFNSFKKNILFLDDYDIANFKVENCIIDARVILGGEYRQMWIPKIHKDLGLLPDIYVAIRVDSSLEKADFIGFIETKDLKINSENKNYLIVDSDQLKSVDEIKDVILSYQNHENVFDVQEHDIAQSYFLEFIEDKIDPNEKKAFINHLLYCESCRNDFYNFYKINNKLTFIGKNKLIDFLNKSQTVQSPAHQDEIKPVIPIIAPVVAVAPPNIDLMPPSLPGADLKATDNTDNNVESFENQIPDEKKELFENEILKTEDGFSSDEINDFLDKLIDDDFVKDIKFIDDSDFLEDETDSVFQNDKNEQEQSVKEDLAKEEQDEHKEKIFEEADLTTENNLNQISDDNLAEKIVKKLPVEEDITDNSLNNNSNFLKEPALDLGLSACETGLLKEIAPDALEDGIRFNLDKNCISDENWQCIIPQSHEKSKVQEIEFENHEGSKSEVQQPNNETENKNEENDIKDIVGDLNSVEVLGTFEDYARLLDEDTNAKKIETIEFNEPSLIQEQYNEPVEQPESLSSWQDAEEIKLVDDDDIVVHNYDEEEPEAIVVEKEHKEHIDFSILKKKMTLKIIIGSSLVCILLIVGVSVFYSQNQNSKLNTSAPMIGTNVPPSSNGQGAQNNVPPSNTLPTPSDNAMQSQNNVPPAINNDNVSYNQGTSGAAIKIRSVSWKVAVSLAGSTSFRNYLMMTGQTLKMNLSKSLLITDQRISNTNVKVQIAFDQSGNIKATNIQNSSGSSQVDTIILNSIKDTLALMKMPKVESDKKYIIATLIINL